MYGASDIYNSPLGVDDEDDLLDEDDLEEVDDEFGAILGIGKGGGVLGIALTSKAREKKIARIVGKLKELYELGKLDKAKRFAKSLRGPVKHLEKKGEYEPTAEVQAWLDFAETGDEEALIEALDAMAWTGDEEASVASDESGVRGGGGGGRRRRHLPPGFRPPRYARWGPRHKASWLRRHPVAASVPSPMDPPGFRAGVPVARPVPMARPVPVARPVGRPVASAVRPRGPAPMRGAARMAFAREMGRQRAQHIAQSRYGLDDAVQSGVEDAFGAAPGRIGADAFQQLADRDEDGFLTSSTLFDEDDDDEVGDDDIDLDDEQDEGQEPQFGALFRRDVEGRLEAARSKYERLKAKAVSDEDWEKVNQAYQQYKTFSKAYRRAATAPTLKQHERVLAEIQDDPEFTFSSRAPQPLGEDATWDRWVSSRSMPDQDLGEADDIDLDDDLLELDEE